MDTFRGLEKRVRLQEDVEAIKRLKARYFRAIDMKLWDELAGVFTEDATGEYPIGACRGRAAIVKHIAESEGVGIITTHQGHNPEIELAGENIARGYWELSFRRTDTQAKTVQSDGAWYEDEYLKEADGQWRISKLLVRTLTSERTELEI